VGQDGILRAEWESAQTGPINNRSAGWQLLATCPTTKPVFREATVLEVILKRFDEPDEVRTFDKGKFEVVHIAGMTIGRATYEPGWRWSAHVGKTLGKKSCDVEHVGLVISGRATAAMDDGRVVEMKAGDVFYIAPGHDSWVVGEEPYVSLHLMGASGYATKQP
jgi:quercetin dioxygenase-like cupin family protein